MLGGERWPGLLSTLGHEAGLFDEPGESLKGILPVALLTAELPGVDPNAIDISILGDTLTLSGVRKEEVLKEGEVCHREERPTGEFQRTLELPVKVNPDKVEAAYAQGILRVTLSRAEETKPKQIKVKI